MAATARRAIVDERLREREFGLWDRLTTAGVRQKYPDQAEQRAILGKFYHRPPGGESWTDVVLRVRSVLADVRSEHVGQRVWVFTHQAVIMAFRFLLESLTEQELLRIDGSTPLGNCSLTVYRPTSDGGLDLVVYGDVGGGLRSQTSHTRRSHRPRSLAWRSSGSAPSSSASRRTSRSGASPSSLRRSSAS